MSSAATVPTTSSSSKQRHPIELVVLFAAEMWERFGFYTVAALITLYLQYGGFGYTRARSTELWSNYLMLVYATPLVGGWLADRFLGYRWAVIIGAIGCVAGYALLAVGQVATFYLGLALLCIFNGLFKPNISTMVGNLYPAGSPLKDSAYNIFYMGINIGAFLAPVVAEAIRQHFVPDAIYKAAQQGIELAAADQARLRAGFLTGFMAAAAGMVLGTIILSVFYRRLARVDQRRGESTAIDPEVTDTEVPSSVPQTVAPARAVDAVPEWQRIAALLVVYAIVVVFWMVFHQNGTTLTYWADGNTDWQSSKTIPYIVTALSLGTIDASQASGVISNAINPFWIIVLSMPLVWFWGVLRKRGLEPSTPAKMAIGMLLASAAFFIMYIAATQGGEQVFQLDEQGRQILNEKGVPLSVQGKVSPWWLIGAYAVLSIGELCLSPMGLSLVSKVAPARMRGLMMGGWFVATAIGNKLTMIGKLWDYWPHAQFWGLCATCALVMGLVLAILLRPLKRAMPGV